MNHTHHPGDAELTRSRDAELPPPRQRAIEAHLSACRPCADRLARLIETLALATEDDRDASSWQHERSRAQLRIKLGEVSQEPDRAWSSLAGRFWPVPRWALFAAAATAALLIAKLVPAPGPPSSHFASSVAGVERGALPEPTLTPGAVWTARAEALCSGVPPRGVVTAATRREVLRAYGMEAVPPEQYELDYLITPELGGAPEARNLWPQLYASRAWNARVKDQLEDLLPQLVCGGKLELQVAQQEMADNWIAAYRKYFNTSAPLIAAGIGQGGVTPARLASRTMASRSIIPGRLLLAALTLPRPLD
jgi:hypothetical protein